MFDSRHRLAFFSFLSPLRGGHFGHFDGSLGRIRPKTGHFALFFSTAGRQKLLQLLVLQSAAYAAKNSLYNIHRFILDEHAVDIIQ